MPEQCCRPHLWPSDKTRELAVDPEAKDGPDGTVRVIVTTKSEPLPAKWIAIGSIRTETTSPENRSRQLFEPQRLPRTEQYDKFAQSPSGIWYPQVVRRTTLTTIRSRTGKRNSYVDFNDEMDSALFRPVSAR